MVPRGPERVFLHQPAGREDDKVSDGGADVVGLRCQDRVDAGIGVVEGDAADDAEAAQVVFVGVVQAVPGDDVKGRVVLLGRVQVACEFGGQSPGGVGVFVEGGDRGLEVAGVGEAVGSDGPEFGELEVPLVELEDVAADWTGGEGDAVADTAGDDADLIGPHEDLAELGLDVEHAVLEDDEEVAVCRVEGFVRVHVFACCEDEHA